MLLALVALALPAGEAAAVLCDTTPGEAMPCCDEGLSDCGTDGMLGDCCVLVPGESAPPAVASWLALDSASVLRWHLAAQPAVALVAPILERAASCALRPAGPRARAHSFFSRTTVLRI